MDTKELREKFAEAITVLQTGDNDQCNDLPLEEIRLAIIEKTGWKFNWDFGSLTWVFETEHEEIMNCFDEWMDK